MSTAMVEPRPTRDRYVDPHAGSDERTYAMFTHLAGLLSLTGAPTLGTLAVGGLIAAVIMWRIKHAESPFLDDHGRDATNFQISLLIYYFIAAVIIVPTFGISLLGYPAVAVLTCIGCIRGAMAANRGEYYRYPMTLRFIKPPLA